MFEHDLAELAARREALVGGGGLVEREGLGDRHAQRARVEQRQHLALEAPRGERLLLQRPRAQGRAVDARALAHQREQVQLALGAGGHADHDDPPAGGERVQVLGQVGGADQLEDHVERAVLGEALGRDRLGAERRHLRRAAPRGARSPSRARPRRGASWIAAVPTPPAPPCTSRRSPGRSPAWVKIASWAVVNTSGSPPAAGQSRASGHRHQLALVHRRKLGLRAAADDRHHARRPRRSAPRPARARPPRRRAPARGCPAASRAAPGRARAAASCRRRSAPRRARARAPRPRPARGRGAPRSRSPARGWWRRASAESLLGRPAERGRRRRRRARTTRRTRCGASAGTCPPGAPCAALQPPRPAGRRWARAWWGCRRRRRSAWARPR